MSLRDMPPLAAVRVFEAAARRLSFTQAAEELGMTQAAVSYQIKVIEERLGAPLFLRRPRAVELTPAGHLLAPAASEALETLAAAFSAARENLGGILSISVLPTFAAHWLAPRIGEFQMAQPDIVLHDHSHQRLVPRERGLHRTFGILVGRLGGHRDLNAHVLADDDMARMHEHDLGFGAAAQVVRDLCRDMHWLLAEHVLGHFRIDLVAVPVAQVRQEHLGARRHHPVRAIVWQVCIAQG